MNTGGVALDVTKGKFVVVNRIPFVGRAKRHIPVRSRTEGPVDTRGGEIPNTRFGVGVDQGRNAAKAQVVGKIAVITVNVAERIDLGLEERDNVSIFRVCNRTQEDRGAGAGIEVVILLSLQTEVQEVSMTEVEHVRIAVPCWGQNGHGGIESRYREL